METTMKYYFTITLGFLILATPAFACNNQIPLSEAIKAVNLEPGAGGKSCADLPQEECLCFDGIDWHAAEIVTVQIADESKPIYSGECPQGQDGCLPAGYELKEAKALQHDQVKLAARVQADAQEEAAREQRKQERREAREGLKNCISNIDAVSTQPAKVNAVKACLQGLIRIIE